MYQFQQKIKSLKGKIKHWNLESFGNIFQEKKQLEHKMKEVQQVVMTQGFSKEMRAQEQHLLKELNLKEQREDILWKNKYKHRWLKEVEHNTKFFHKETICH